MDNKEFLENLKFGVGDGNLQYYIYNWKCPEMPSDKVKSALALSPGLSKCSKLLWLRDGIILSCSGR